MISKQEFIDRIRYGKHTFSNGDFVYAKPHINPDGREGGWVAETALVEDACYISPSSEVCEYAHVKGRARIDGSSVVSGFAVVGGDAWLTNQAIATDYAIVEGSVFIGGEITIGGYSHIDYGNLEKDGIYMGYRQLLRCKKNNE